MQLYPAIDIKDKKCVRLKQGLFDQVQVYSEDPVQVALEWERAGASFIHLVDLDGALQGRGVNRDVICDIVRSVHIPVQLGGGIRSLSDMEEVLNMGVFRGIVGTKAVTDPKLLKKMVDSFGPSHVVCGIDAKNGLVATQGWVDVSNISAIELALQMKVYGVRTIVYTDISKDGMLTGPNVSATKTLSDATGLDIIASGGMSCMDDLQAISDAKIHGAIIGKALYEKRIDLKEAVLRFEKQQ